MFDENETVGLAVKKLADERSYDGAQQLAETMMPDYFQADAFQFVGLRLMQNGQPERAIQNIRRAEMIARQEDVLWEQANLLNKLAKLYFERADQARAEELRSVAISVCHQAQEKNGPDPDVGSMLWEIAEDLMLAGLSDRAHEVAETSTTAAVRVGRIDLHEDRS